MHVTLTCAVCALSLVAGAEVRADEAHQPVAGPAEEHEDGGEPAAADEPPEEPVPGLAAMSLSSPVRLHGFVSQGFLASTGNNYLARSKRGSFEFAEAALNATVAPAESLSASMQLFSRDLGPIGDYTVKLDWFHLDWHPRDEIGLRAGRVRMPFGLYNEVSDYDPGRVSILPPQSLYGARSRDYLLALTGGEIYGSLDLGPSGFLDYRAFGGTLFFDVSDSPVPVEIDVPYTSGARVMWEPPVSGLRLGGSFVALKIQGSYGGAMYELPALLPIASAEYQRGRFLFAAEYSRWYTDLDSSDETVIPSQEAVSERYYFLSAVELTSALRAGAYYSGAFEDVDDRGDSTRYQHDVAATLRFDVNPFWLVKLEGHYMNGTGDVQSSLNPGPAEERPENWAVFLAKTTAYF